MLTCILKIKTSIDQAAAEALAIFGQGGNPNAEQIELFLGYVNTPVVNGHTRVLIGHAFGQALEYIAANGGSEHADLVRVEWGGQDMVEKLVADEGGNESLQWVEEPFVVGTEPEVTLEDGAVTPARPVYLGRIG